LAQMSDRQHTAESLTGVVRRARRRLVFFRTIDAVCLGLAIAMSLLVLLLGVGIQILSAPVLVALAGIAVAITVVRAVRSVPSVADVSRLLDTRCGLADALSTALHFKDSPSEMAQLQRSQAEKLAQTVELSSAIVFHLPRSAWVFAGSAVLVLLLGGFRYVVERHLTLIHPRAAAPQDALSLAVEADAVARERRSPNPAQPVVAPDGTQLASLGANAKTVANVSSGQPPSQSSDPAGAQQNAEQPATEAQNSIKSEEAASSPRAGSEKGPGSQEGSPQSAPSGGKQASPPSSSGMLSKLRDAVSSLVSKLSPKGDQPPSNAQGSPQGNGKQPSGQPGGSKNTAGGENADAKAGGDDAASQDSDKQAGAKGQGKGGDQSASAKPGSGMGRQDGSKELKDAEQQAAMGKLSEIIGKRSAGVSGEMTIEPQSGPQQLRTAYSKSDAKHAAAGGDVNRDEVPIALQSYVQEYFVQVRKQAAVKTARAGKPETHE
jgi:hypothetical protein